MVTAQDLLNGASLRVVLHPDRELQVDFPDMIEAFELPHVLVEGEKFIGKTSNRHALGYEFQKYDLNTGFSYAYANFANVVVNCSQATGLFRAYHRNAYRDIRFVSVSHYRPIWESGRTPTIEPVEAAIDEGRLLRVALLDGEGIWNLHPVHMPSYYVGERFFELFTEQDAVPVFFRKPSSLVEIEKELLRRIEAERKTKGFAKDKDAYRLAVGQPDAQFYSCCYTIRSNGEYLRGETYHRHASALRYQALKVFAEI